MHPDIRIGVAGFSYPDWAGIVYRASLKSSARLACIAQFLETVEINTSFYGPLKPAVARQWCDAVAAVNRDFIFTAKLYRAFTHSPHSGLEPASAQTIRFTAEDVSETKRGLDALAEREKLGAVLAQFPISFKLSAENKAYLERLFGLFREYPLVLEVRHLSWNDPAVLSWLAELRVGICNIDQPLLGKAIRPGAAATSPLGYVRLHGRNYTHWFSEAPVRDRYDYLYSRDELAAWKHRTVEVASKTRRTFVIANNHNFGKAAVNALELIALIENTKVKAPRTLLQHYPQLDAITAETF